MSDAPIAYIGPKRRHAGRAEHTDFTWLPAKQKLHRSTRAPHVHEGFTLNWTPRRPTPAHRKGDQ